MNIVPARARDPPGDLGLRAAPDPLVRVRQGACRRRKIINKITFEIEADMWAQPYPERLYLKTELDLDAAPSACPMTGAGARHEPAPAALLQPGAAAPARDGRRVRPGTRRSPGGSGSTASNAPTRMSSACWKASAFLAARVQMKIDAEFPRFTQHLAELVYPHFLAPTPSMAVVQLQPTCPTRRSKGLPWSARQRHAQRARQGRPPPANTAARTS
jgi:hypothetical protein